MARILTKLLTGGAGLVALFVAVVWAQVAFAWGSDSFVGWIWLIICLVASGASLYASVKEVSTKSLWVLIAVDILLLGTLFLL